MTSLDRPAPSPPLRPLTLHDDDEEEEKEKEEEEEAEVEEDVDDVCVRAQREKIVLALPMF